MLGKPDLVVVGLAATFLAYIIAILRHDLYYVDRVISTAVAYGLGTAGLLGLLHRRLVRRRPHSRASVPGGCRGRHCGMRWSCWRPCGAGCSGRLTGGCIRCVLR